jgi:hypothetical protein
VNEGHLGAFRAGSRLAINEPYPSRIECRQRRSDIVDAQRQMMHARTA